jgi:hypothetical protein
MRAEADTTADDDRLEAALQQPHPVAATQALALTVGFCEEGDGALPEEAQPQQQRAVAERAAQQSADGEWSDGTAGEYTTPLAMSMAQYTDAWAHEDLPMDPGGSSGNSKMEVRAGDATGVHLAKTRRAYGGDADGCDAFRGGGWCGRCSSIASYCARRSRSTY